MTRRAFIAGLGSAAAWPLAAHAQQPQRMRRMGVLQGNAEDRDTRAWVAAGLPLETGATRMADQADDVHLMPRERGMDREAAMREYLTWEINLVNDMAQDDDHRFRVVAG